MFPVAQINLDLQPAQYPANQIHGLGSWWCKPCLIEYTTEKYQWRSRGVLHLPGGPLGRAIVLSPSSDKQSLSRKGFDLW